MPDGKSYLPLETYCLRHPQRIQGSGFAESMMWPCNSYHVECRVSFRVPHETQMSRIESVIVLRLGVEVARDTSRNTRVPRRDG